MTLTEFCTDHLDGLLTIGKWFLWLSLAVAVFSQLVLWFATIRKALAGQQGANINESVPVTADATGIDKILEAAQGLVEALSNAPTWLAMFLCGLALVWLSLSQLDGTCAAAAPADAAAAEAAAPAPAAEPS